MKRYTEHCDLCGKEFNNDKNGFFIEIGYSKGGWGDRKDFVAPKSLEVCTCCFKTLEVGAILIKDAISDLRNKGD